MPVLATVHKPGSTVNALSETFPPPASKKLLPSDPEQKANATWRLYRGNPYALALCVLRGKKLKRARELSGKTIELPHRNAHERGDQDWLVAFRQQGAALVNKGHGIDRVFHHLHEYMEVGVFAFRLL